MLRWFTSRVPNGLLEGLNSLIQAAKARARGYRTTRYLVTMIYLLVGKLELRLPPLRLVAHAKWRGSMLFPSPSRWSIRGGGS